MFSTYFLFSINTYKVTFYSDIVVYAPKRLHNKFEDDSIRYDGNYDTDKIKKFLENDM